MLRRFMAAWTLLLAATATGSAQEPPRVTPGWGVDTAATGWSELAWHHDVPGIYRAWREFLRATPGTPGADTLWSASERRAWPAYDLTSAAAHQGFPATVLDIRPAAPGQGDSFVVQTLFANAVEPEYDVKPVALTRVYAVRENGRWVFANALPRLTAGWHRVRLGPITYVFSPLHRFDGARAEDALHFADSLATAFGLLRIEPMTYYVADSPAELLRIIGVEWTLGGQGYGYAMRANRLLLTGDPGFGEENRHELTHYVLSPLVKWGRTHPLVSEGVASWLGGTMGRPYPVMMREYAAFLRANPQITLDSVMEAAPDLGVRPGGAMLALMVFERGGVPAVKALFDGGSSDVALRQSVERLLGIPWARVQTTWRERVEASAAPRAGIR